MKKSFTYSEKAIGTFLIVVGAVFLYVNLYTIIIFIEFSQKFSHFTWKDISILKLIRTYHFEILLDTLMITSGLLILLNKKSGWILALTTSAVTVFLCIKNLVSLFGTPLMTGVNKTELLLLNSILLLVFLLILFFLLSKTLRIKYHPTKKTLWIIVMVVAVLLIDKIFLIQSNKSF